jgi:hypothetical protein
MSNRKTFVDSIIPLPNQSSTMSGGLMVNAAAPLTDEMMTVHFSLAAAADVVKQLERKSR